MTHSKTVLILGGGVGGLVAANELRQLLPWHHRIILVERNENHAFAPSFLWVMTGHRRPGRITQPVKVLLRSGVDFLRANVLAIDSTRAQVETDQGVLAYDYLIVALGAELAPGEVPGLAGVAHTFYTLDGAGRLHNALREFCSGRIAVVVAALPYKCPGAPLEGAMLIADFFSRCGRRAAVEIDLFTPESQPMPVAGPLLANAASAMLAARKIRYHSLHQLQSVDGVNKQMLFADKGAIPYDLLVAIPPHRSPDVIRKSVLANETGWIPVDRFSMVTKVDNVYTIGDVTSIPIPGRWKPEVPLMLPKAGVFAHAQALVVARRVAGSITGRESNVSFCGDGYCMLEAGADLAGFAYGNFFAEPSPEVKLKKIGKAWHVGKILFEKWWLAPHGIRRTAYRYGLLLGGKIMGARSMI
ncbi:MAG: FAD/NAD(P)-binding oxidoreductase [Candidatus Zixiibacteriota bacterium]